MKTQKEIEQLAQERSTFIEFRFGFVAGYEECQENIGDKKYTEEDMLFAFVHGGTKFEENKDVNVLTKNFKELINSLKKKSDGNKS